MNRLLANALEGDRRAEEQLFEILRARVTTIAKRRVWEREALQDIVQQTCLTVLEKYKTEEFPAGFELWVNGVLRMKIGNYLQSKKIRRDRFDLRPSAEVTHLAAAAEWNPGLEAALVACLKKIARIRPKYARVLSLSYQGYKTNEICQRLRITRSNLHSILSRGRSLLNQCVETGRV